MPPPPEKSKRGFVKICMAWMRLNRKGRDLLTSGQGHLEHGLRHEDRREQVRQQADEQCHGKPANRAGANWNRNAHEIPAATWVSTRPEHNGEACVDGGPNASIRFRAPL